MNGQVRTEIKDYVKNVLTKKFNEYSAETEYKPFFEALFSKKDVYLGSVIQSLYTTFGMSVYEQLAVMLAKSAGFHAERQYELLGEIDFNTENLIASHWNELKTGIKNKTGIVSNKTSEIQMIKQSILPGKSYKDGDSTVDVFIKKPDGSEYYIDITTVKNNKKGFESLKLKMLRWIALRASTCKEANAQTYIAIPYNPYHPKDYLDSRWNSTILDRKNDILIQEDFWNFVGNDVNTYNDLLCIFNEVGIEMQNKINKFFSF